MHGCCDAHRATGPAADMNATLTTTNAPPRLVFALGCSGSTAVMSILYKLITAIGVKPLGGACRECKDGFTVQRGAQCFTHVGSNWEATKERKNCFFQQALLSLPRDQAESAFIAQTYAAVQAHNASWVVLSSFLSVRMARAFVALGTHAVYLERANLLDRLVCVVRDCFRTDFGHAVYRNGTNATLCFTRRFLPSVTTLARFPDPDLLIARAQTLRAENRHYRAKLSSWWASAGDHTLEAVTTEALTAFQYGDMQTSASEWYRLLRSLRVVFPSVASVANTLRNTGMWNSRRPPSTQASTIYNWEAVREAVLRSGDSELISMLRG